MRIFIAIFIVWIISSDRVVAETPLSPKQVAAGAVLTAAAIAALIVQDSRNEYYKTSHPCACPDDLTRNGRTCGNMSAYIRPGGAHPLCSPADVTPGMIEDYRNAKLKGASK